MLANCLTHGRRNFVEVADHFPDECQYVLETLGKVYHYEAIAATEGMTPEQRLHFHQGSSGPLMSKALAQGHQKMLPERKPSALTVSQLPRVF